jgi:very-short-patch-repair endonuclease
MKINSTITKQVILNFIEKNRENFSIQLKRKYKRIYNEIDLLPGKKFAEKMYFLFNGDDDKKCIVCDDECKFDGYYKGYRKTCSAKCNGIIKKQIAREFRKCITCGNEFEVYKKRQKSCCSDVCFEKFMKTDEVKNKRLQSNIKYNLEKHGVEYYTQTDEFVEKTKNKKLERYGNPIYVNSEKAKETCIERYGVENPAQNEKVKQKMKETCIKRYGVDNFAKTKTFKKDHFDRVYDRISSDNRFSPKFSFNEYSGINNKYEFSCNKCSLEFEYNVNNGKYPMCPKCDTKDNTFEIEIEEFIKTIYDGKIHLHNRTILGKKELDFYLPEINVAIEFNGNYWHSEYTGGKHKKYHLDKTEQCEKSGIQLIHIFEDEWLLNKEIVKSKLRSILKCNKNSVYARNCIVKEIKSKQKNEFLEKNHIQGKDRCKIKLGLFHEDELISVMTFGDLRISLGNKPQQNHYELIRFSSSIRCIGGASKLFKYFTKNYKPKQIISYADRRFSIGNLYNVLGFNLVSKTEPNYWYFHLNSKVNKRHHRSSFQKHKLPKLLNTFDPKLTEWQNMKLNGYDRVWDCGNLKFIWESE